MEKDVQCVIIAQGRLKAEGISGSLKKEKENIQLRVPNLKHKVSLEDTDTGREP